MTRVDGVRIASSPMGPVDVSFAPTHDDDVLHHEVRLGRGRTNAKFNTDTAAVRADLSRLSAVLTGG